MVDPVTILGCLVLGVDPALVNAVITVESNWNPAAINVNRWDADDFETDDFAKNAATVEIFVEHGYTVDVGLMQINSRNLQHYGVTPIEAFDICTNVQLGEQILTDAINHARDQGRQGDDAIRGALSIYNTGNLSAGFANGYVEKVWHQYRNPRTGTTPELKAHASDTVVPLSGWAPGNDGINGNVGIIGKEFKTGFASEAEGRTEGVAEGAVEESVESSVQEFVGGLAGELADRNSDLNPLFDYASGPDDLIVDWRRHE